MIQNKAILFFALSLLILDANSIDLSVYFSAPQTPNNFYLVETYPEGEILKFTNAGNIIKIDKITHAETTFCQTITLPDTITTLAITTGYVFLMGDNDNSILINLSSCKKITLFAVYKLARIAKNGFLNLQRLQNKLPTDYNPYGCSYRINAQFDFTGKWSMDVLPNFYFQVDFENRFSQYLDGSSYLQFSSQKYFQITRFVIDLDLDDSGKKLITCDEDGYVTLFNFDDGSQAPIKKSKLQGNIPCDQVVYRRKTAWALSSGKVTRIEAHLCWRLTTVETNKNIKYIYLSTDTGPGTLRLIGNTEILTLNCHENCQTCTGPDFDECLICKDGSTAINGACCHESCNTCSGSCCLTCQPGYKLILNDFCELSCHPSCRTCSGPNSNNCLSCNSGFYFDSDNTCKSCHDNCLTCISYRRCTSCKTRSLI